MAKIKFTKYGVFKMHEMLIDVKYSKVSFGGHGESITAIETTSKTVDIEPIILWNAKGYFKELNED